MNSPTQFTVDFNGVQGKLEAKVVSPSGTETDANVQQIQQGLVFYARTRSIAMYNVTVSRQFTYDMV